MHGGELTREVADGIYRIDVNHPQPQHTCAYLITCGTAAALLDCGGGRRGAAAVMAGLAHLGIDAAQVQWLIVTHAHLDHAGAAGLLMQELPQARFAAHPSALKHLLNPQKALGPATAQLFGEAFFDKYYGGLCAVEEARAQALADGEEVHVGTRTLVTHYTPGHAWHHASFYDAQAEFIVAGDAYGNSYHASRSAQNPLGILIPVMPPTQFDPPTMMDSIRRLHALRAQHIGLSHFDVIEEAANGDAYCTAQLQALEAWQTAAADLYAEDAANFEARMKAYMFDWLSAQATAGGADAAQMRQLYTHDINLSAGGFAYYMQKSAAA